MGDSVEVTVDGGYAHLNVRFDQPTDDGRFDCVAIQEAVRNKVGQLLPEWRGLLDRPAFVETDCPDKAVA